MRALVVLAVGTAMAFSLSSISAVERDGPAKNGVGLGHLPPSPPTPPKEIDQTPASLPVGRWSVEFANGVTEVCEIGKDGTASVVEPVRISGGKAVVSGGSVLMVFENGRVQRWTPIGKRFVVEHWFPGSQFPTAAPGVLGIAERAK
jgi:hypothetical protein